MHSIITRPEEFREKNLTKTDAKAAFYGKKRGVLNNYQ